MQKNQFLKVKNCLLELEKDFIEQKDVELKDRDVKTKKEIIVSVDDMDWFGKKEIKKIRPTKNTWFDWLTNFVPESIRKSVGGFKDKIVSLFKTNTLTSYMKRDQKKKKKKEQNN